ncbi:DNA recombination/repair protein RecA, partial [Bacillus thuringiensis]|nr:DNA recombination/repair protein RecA [Bacillus thuringiensis]
EHDCKVGFIKPIRVKIGGVSPAGTPTTASGGRALPFYASESIELEMGEYIEDGRENIGHWVRTKVVNNRIDIPFKEPAFPLIYG